jgi:putative FmdB family regulatory protein
VALPLYEYECPECGTFERMQKFSDPALSRCPTCASPVEKLLSAPAIQFKGSGWYVTDYARKSSGKEGGKEAGAGEGGDAKGGQKDGGADKPSTDKGGARESSSAGKSTGKA